MLGSPLHAINYISSLFLTITLEISMVILKSITIEGNLAKKFQTLSFFVCSLNELFIERLILVLVVYISFFSFHTTIV